MDNCVFCKIVQGQVPAYQVWEDKDYLAFLTISPHQKGHTLLIPKNHTDYLFDLEEQEISEIFLKSKPLALALKKAFIPKTGKVGVVVAGMGVPHVHIHLIPMDSEEDLNFQSAKHNLKPEEFEQSLNKIKQSLP